MRLYSVHVPPEEPAPPERYAFIKDGFSWPAFFVPILFILWHRLWLTLVYSVAFVLAVAWTDRLLGEGMAVTVAIFGVILFALEANNIRRLSLESRGWREVGGSYGQGVAEAEARFFGRPASQEAPGKGALIARAAYTPAARETGADEPILGLFPEPER